MNQGESRDETGIRRIMIALDGSPRSRELIETAAQLAARIGSELIGLFVEDVDLLRLTGFPFVREVGFFSPALRAMERTDVERQLRAQAGWMRVALKETADRLLVPWEFRVARGPVATELLAAGEDADLLILGKVGRSFLQRQRIGSTVRTLLVKRAGLTMIMQEKRRAYKGPHPIIVAYDGSELAREGVRVAIILVDEKEAPLKIILLADDQGHAASMKEAVGRELQSREMKAQTRSLINPSVERLARMLALESGGPVVIPCDSQLIGEEAVCTLMNEIPNPVLVVRS